MSRNFFAQGVVAMPFLSFCIPTRQRIKLLQQTLESILSQITQEIEIVISDNASSDGTQQALELLQQSYDCIVYHRFEKEVACGDNLMHVVSMAQGEYCWLMTDDDVIEKNALAKVVEFLKKHPGISGCSVNVQGYCQDMRVKKNIFYSHRLKQDQIFYTAQEFFAALGAWIGFWSAQIVSKKKWDEALLDTRYLQYQGYHHLFVITAIVYHFPYFGYLHEKLVGYRSDNESFSKEYGKSKRFLIDLQAYQGVGSTFFLPHVIKKVQAQVLRALLFWQIVRFKIVGLSFQEIWLMFRQSYRVYKGFLFYWFVFVPLLFCPSWILHRLRPAFKLMRKWL